MLKNILVTGGAGYIGSCMVRVLLAHGYNVVVFDNLSSGCRKFVPGGVKFVKGDALKYEDIDRALKTCGVEAVIHFAGYIVVPESVKDPVKYYHNNVAGCINLLAAMKKYNVKKIIFSSTAAVYGEPKKVPITEDAPVNPLNPYGHSKLMAERIIEDASCAYGFSYALLRYFNVAGAHHCGEIGENHEPETHLIPNILRAARGKSKELAVFGDNYPTPDGTCVRDYIHVQDLCNAHLLALEAMSKKLKGEVFNLGSNSGYSVKEVIETVEKVTGKRIKFKILPPRPGDAAVLTASSAKAKRILGWRLDNGLEEIIKTAWEWEKKVFC